MRQLLYVLLMGVITVTVITPRLIDNPEISSGIVNVFGLVESSNYELASNELKWVELLIRHQDHSSLDKTLRNYRMSSFYRLKAFIDKHRKDNEVYTHHLEKACDISEKEGNLFIDDILSCRYEQILHFSENMNFTIAHRLKEEMMQQPYYDKKIWNVLNYNYLTKNASVYDLELERFLHLYYLTFSFPESIIKIMNDYTMKCKSSHHDCSILSNLSLMHSQCKLSIDCYKTKLRNQMKGATEDTYSSTHLNRLTIRGLMLIIQSFHAFSEYNQIERSLPVALLIPGVCMCVTVMLDSLRVKQWILKWAKKIWMDVQASVDKIVDYMQWMQQKMKNAWMDLRMRVDALRKVDLVQLVDGLKKTWQAQPCFEKVQQWWSSGKIQFHEWSSEVKNQFHEWWSGVKKQFYNSWAGAKEQIDHSLQEWKQSKEAEQEGKTTQKNEPGPTTPLPDILVMFKIPAQTNLNLRPYLLMRHCSLLNQSSAGTFQLPEEEVYGYTLMQTEHAYSIQLLFLQEKARALRTHRNKKHMKEGVMEYCYGYQDMLTAEWVISPWYKKDLLHYNFSDSQENVIELEPMNFSISHKVNETYKMEVQTERASSGNGSPHRLNSPVNSVPIETISHEYPTIRTESVATEISPSPSVLSQSGSSVTYAQEVMYPGAYSQTSVPVQGPQGMMMVSNIPYMYVMTPNGPMLMMPVLYPSVPQE